VLRGVLGGFGYREVRTPLLEYAEVMDRAQDGGIGRAYRLFDDHGQVLVVRPDLTVPVARLVAGRLADHPGPLRVTYVSERLRPAPVGKARRAEELQAGLELVGVSGPAADAEVVAVLVTALRRAGVGDLTLALGDVSLTRAVLDGVGVAAGDQARLQAAARARNLVAWRREAAALDLPATARETIAALPSMRGGDEILAAIAAEVPAAAGACDALRRTLALVAAHGAADAVMVDLGVLRDWGYYSGIVVEAYAPGTGRPIAVGGRYDGLVGRFGAPRPAVGAAILLDRLHEALAARNGGNGPADGAVVAGGMDDEIELADALRAAGVAAVGAPADGDRAERLAAADGWRWVVRRDGDVYTVSETGGSTRRAAGVGEVIACLIS
jgi:ATP phosphoribosyltransferase regulatory subunit